MTPEQLFLHFVAILAPLRQEHVRTVRNRSPMVREVGPQDVSLTPWQVVEKARNDCFTSSHLSTLIRSTCPEQAAMFYVSQHFPER